MLPNVTPDDRVLPPFSPLWRVNLQQMESVDDPARRRRLVAQTAHFAGTFLKWADRHSDTGLTYQKIRLLYILDTRGPAIMKDLSAQLGMTARNMTSTIDSLEKAGLVKRTPHAADRRATIVEMVPGGVAVAKPGIGAELDSMAVVFESFSNEDIVTFIRMLGRIYDAMSNEGERD
jgi:DNA-binding MarR family transcriptional regulator